MFVVDHIIVYMGLIISGMIGLYVAFFKKHWANTPHRYMYGDRTIKAIPIGLSLFSSGISGTVMIGEPSEMYTFGTQYSASFLGLIISSLLICYVLLPIFCSNLKLNSPCEYFERRFGRLVSGLVVLFYVTHSILYMPIVLFTSVLFYSEISGLPLVFCSTLIGSVCVFYTLIGGFVAVIWTDVLQSVLMILSVLTMAGRALYNIGSVSEIFSRAEYGGRLQFFNMDLNPFQRMTFWTSVVGLGISHAVFRTHPASLQRYMVLKDEKSGKISIGVWAFANVFSKLSTAFIGLAMFAYYFKCDPVKNKEISTSNKLVPHFLNDILGSFPGIAGIFSMGFINAGLSTLSSELNIMSCIIHTDLLRKFWKKPLTDKQEIIVMKIIVCCLGILTICLAPVLEGTEYIMQVSLTIAGGLIGSECGIFVLGVLFPWANEKGALIGCFVATVLNIWINYGALSYKVARFYILPTSTENCSNIFNTTENIISTTEYMIKTVAEETEDIFFLYKLSYTYYSILNIFVVATVGMVISYFTGFTDIKNLDPRLVLPVFRKYTKPHSDTKNMEMEEKS